jgi:4'-phosphopantetheinyl transferase
VVPIGIDVERVSYVNAEGLVERVLGPGEVVTRPRDFFVYWTRKESVVKATGVGLRVALTDVTVSRPHLPPRLLSHPGMPTMAASMLDFEPRRGYVASLTALCRAMPEVRVMDTVTLLKAPDRSPAVEE